MKQMLNGRDLIDRYKKSFLGIPSNSLSPNHPSHFNAVATGLFDQDNLDLFIGMIPIQAPQRKFIKLHLSSLPKKSLLSRTRSPKETH